MKLYGLLVQSFFLLSSCLLSGGNQFQTGTKLLKFGLFLLLLLLSFYAFPQTPIAIQQVNVVEVKNGRLLKNQTVLIQGATIEKIGKRVKLPGNTIIIKAKGKFLIPGLWDMHYHSFDVIAPEITDSAFTPLLIANGITGVRDMAGVTISLQKRDAVRTGKSIAPEMFIGAMVDGPKPTWSLLATAVKDANIASSVVDSLKALGFDFIKIYSDLPRETYHALAAACKKQNLPFAGHVPDVILPTEAALAGQKSMEHYENLLLQSSPLGDTRPRKSWGKLNILYAGGKDTTSTMHRFIDSFEPARLEKVADTLHKTNTWYCPTLITQQNILKLQDAASDMENASLYEYVPKATRENWKPFAKMFVKLNQEEWEVKAKQIAFMKDLIQRMSDHQVGLLAGDDNIVVFGTTGFSLHQELERLAGCGIKDAEVLKIATYNPAVYFGIEDKCGTVEEGKIASLVLLNANPLTDISNTQKINAVFLKGNYFDRSSLDALLKKVKAYSKTH